MKTLKKSLVLLLITLFILYVGMPVINYGFWGLPLLLTLLIIAWALLGKKAISVIVIDQQFHVSKNVGKPTLIVLGLLVVYLTLLPALTSWALFRNQDYKALIGKVEVGENLSNHMVPISLEKIRVVDQALAQQLGDKVLGSQPALGSQVTLGTFSIQKVNNELYWVAPLLHSGFFKWLMNREGSSGYVMVNATNERDVKLVQQVNGKDVKIKYQPGAYFFDKLERYVYFKGNMFVGLTDYTFEIDDEGTPYWVITTFKKKVGFFGEDATGVVVLNAQTGAIQHYGISEAPAWIDRIQPAAFVEKQLNDWGNYVKGYWNFSNENKLQITESATLVYGEDNRAYWYTGLTSIGSDESTVGFVLVDTRTKKAVWYKQSGATEFAAQNSAKGKVQEKGYYTSAPIPYNINNIPTYVMTLKDNGGLVKMYAMVAIEDYTVVGVGNTLREALMAYKNAFNSTGGKISAKSKSERNVLNAVITRINGDIKNGNTFYYFTLSSSKSIFIGSSQVSNEFPITAIGDSVTVSFDNDSQDLIDVTTFENKSVGK
jgi:hypothetical protein